MKNSYKKPVVNIRYYNVTSVINDASAKEVYSLGEKSGVKYTLGAINDLNS